MTVFMNRIYVATQSVHMTTLRHIDDLVNIFAFGGVAIFRLFINLIFACQIDV